MDHSQIVGLIVTHGYLARDHPVVEDRRRRPKRGGRRRPALDTLTAWLRGTSSR